MSLIIDTDQSTYTLTITTYKQNDEERFAGFYFYPGGIKNLSGSTIGDSPMQSVLWAYAIICYGIIIAAIIVCAKSKVRLKALWIIGFFVQNGFSFAHRLNGESFQNSFMVQFIKIGKSGLTLFPNGAYELILVFPVLALVFLISKNSLEKKALVYRERTAAQSEIPAASESISESSVSE